MDSGQYGERFAAVTRRRALGLGLGVAGAGAFAAACGRGDDKDKKQSAATQAPSTAAASSNSDTPKPGGTGHARISGTPPLDPYANTTFRAQQLASFTYSRLLKFKTGADPAVAMNWEVQPDLAAGWEVAADGTQVTFKLRQNAAFHDKAPVSGRLADSEDVKSSMEKFRAEQKNSNRSVFDPFVEKVETPDAKTVVLKLKAPYGPILNVFANPQYLWILPKESHSGYDPAKDQIGTGPFVFESLQPDVDVKLKRHPKYFLEGKPYAANWQVPIIVDTVQGKAQFQAKRLDIENITFEDKAEVTASNPDAKWVTYIPTTTPFIAFQLRGNSPFRDERVRRAFSMLFDRDSLLQLSFTGQGTYHNFVPAFLGKWWLDPKSGEMGDAGKWYKRNVAEAKQLLEAAGQSKMAFRFIYTNNAYGERFNQWAEATASMYKEAGLAPQIVIQDYAKEYIASNGTFFGNFEGMFFALQTPFTDAHDFLYNMCHSASKRNHAGVDDAQLTAMIDREAATLDEAGRVKMVRDIQRYLSEKMYYAPGFTGPAFTAYQPWVKGFRFAAGYGIGVESYAECWLDKA